MLYTCCILFLGRPKRVQTVSCRIYRLAYSVTVPYSFYKSSKNEYMYPFLSFLMHRNVLQKLSMLDFLFSLFPPYRDASW